MAIGTRRTVLPGAPPFTVDDLLTFPDDGNRYELFNGRLVVSPALSLLHQDVIFRLQMIMHQVVPPGLKVYNTVNLRASEKDLYIPDLVVVRKATVRPKLLMLAPSDLVLAVEVTSPSTGSIDRGAKTDAYARAGIPAYWRIEPFEGPTVYEFELSGDSYRGPIAHKPGTVLTVSTPYPVSFDPADLLDEDWPNP
ncbi:Uma2 family endonuclease [Nonomuraea sp. GTA35]|uniref:Uma2 family endonuclease n=1 Tax=Nonomuraea sp. GTA35 TaxID=1676746 RepID=UPI0035C0DAC8